MEDTYSYDNLGMIGTIQDKIKQLENSIKQLRYNGTTYANAEKAYKIKLRQKVLEMRSNDVAVGIINLTVYGEPEVAELREKRDIAEAVYKANLEAINAVKLEIRVLDNQVEREYGANLND